MSIKKVFKSRITSCSYCFRSGAIAAFVGGSYATDDDEQIRELQREVGNVGINDSKHPHIYIDEGEQEIDSNALTPFELMKKQAREEVMKELASATALTNDMGTSEQGKLSPQSSVDVASATSNGMPANPASVGIAGLASLIAAKS